MPLTLTDAELVLIRGLRGIMDRIGFSTASGAALPNPDLAGPIAWAILDVGGSVASVVQPAGTDMATIPEGRLREFVDRAKLHLMEDLWGNWGEISESLGVGSTQANDLADRLWKAITAERLRLVAVYPAPATGGGGTDGSTGTGTGTTTWYAPQVGHVQSVPSAFRPP